jgi:O-antigen/teichoic acid export membrane protein
LNLIRKYPEKIKSYFTAGHERSLRTKKNILFLFLFKGLSVIISLLLVPLTLHYLDSARYGIWLTLSSIIGWMSFFDIGLGNGLRNKFAEAKANNDKELARIYVSTTYAVLAVIIIAVFILFLLAHSFLDWTIILNAPVSLKSELHTLIIIVFSLFCLEFIARLINTILLADQKPALSSLISLTANLLTLFLIYLLTIGTESSLLYAGIVFSISTSFLSLIATFYYFSKDYKEYRPSFKLIKWEYSRQLMSLGVKFFIIQVSVITIFSTSNIIITQIFGPSQVTVYNIAYKYFSVITMIFGILVTPFWSAYTEAYVKGDILWIKMITSRLLKIWFICLVVVVLMVIFSAQVYAFWVGSGILVPFSLSILMGVYVLILTWDSIFISFINGIGKVKLQLYLSIFAAVVFIPIAIILGKNFNLGITGVLLGLCLSLLPGAIMIAVQYNKIINSSAHGIWNK